MVDSPSAFYEIQNMIYPGLVSVSFRSLKPEEIIRATSAAGLAGIEWGGDVHVPAGNVTVAAEVAARTRDAGLRVSAYGSYYRLGATSGEPAESVIDSAVALAAPIIRVWAGTVGSAEATEADCVRIVDDARHMCDLAQAAGVRVATEWHGGTLTDTATSALALFNAINHPNLFTYWQAPQRMRPDDCLIDLQAALPRLAGVHVFQWDVQTTHRQALAKGDGWWPGFLATANQLTADIFASLEFVRGDSLEQLNRDAKTLKQWINQLSTPVGRPAIKCSQSSRE